MRDSRQSEGAALLELAERCEQATGPDQALDRDIRRAIQIDAAPSNYTHSLDAAMTLLPEGDDHDLSLQRSVRGGEGFKLWQVRYWLDSVADDPDETGPMVLGEAATPALALCAAALRAQTQSVSPLSNEENES